MTYGEILAEHKGGGGEKVERRKQERKLCMEKYMQNIRGGERKWRGESKKGNEE